MYYCFEIDLKKAQKIYACCPNFFDRIFAITDSKLFCFFIIELIPIFNFRTRTLIFKETEKQYYQSCGHQLSNLLEK